MQKPNERHVEDAQPLASLDEPLLGGRWLRRSIEGKRDTVDRT